MFSVTVCEGTSVKCWWIMPSPRAMASRGELKATGLPWTLDGAGFRFVQPGQHAHQRAFARAVFSQQGMDFTRPQVEVTWSFARHAGEAFDDAAHFDRKWARAVIGVVLSTVATPQGHLLTANWFPTRQEVPAMDPLIAVRTRVLAISGA